jgi:uncharacterized membrane protein YhaH (DUF805 family)
VTWVRLFVSPFNAIGQRSFVHGVIVVLFVNTTLIFGAMLSLHQFLAWPMLSTLWPTICLTAKRLHTFNASGWLQAPQRAVVAVAMLTSLVPTAWWPSNPWLLSGLWLVTSAALAADVVTFLFLTLHPKAPPDVGEIFG